MDNNQNEHPQYINEEYKNANITIDNDPTRYQQAVIDYTNGNKKNNKHAIVNIILLILAAIHHFLLRPIISNFLETVLNRTSLEENVINIILSIYLFVSFILLILAVWNLIKSSKVLKVLYVIIVTIFVAIYAYKYYEAYKVIDKFKNTVSSSLVIKSRELCKQALEHWKGDIITNGYQTITYTGYNGKHCDNKLYLYINKDVSYSITINTSGNVVDYKITDGKFQLNYTGPGLTYESINSDMYVKVDESNQVNIPECSN